jgi:arylsulfatase A-like enzyme
MTERRKDGGPSRGVDPRPNIVLFMTDQQRGDCLGVEDHPVLQTPYLDSIAKKGVRFRKAYTACPVCIPARRTLMTGKKPSSHGVLMNYDTWLEGDTLPQILSQSGYQTHLVGKLHLWPLRKHYGFDSMVWADGPFISQDDSDYADFLKQNGMSLEDAAVSHGSDRNGWVARPWHLDETLHFSNWCAESALSFLKKRDPTVPFFLKVSFHQPHQPCTPPVPYYDRYMNMDLPEPYVGDWAQIFDRPQRGLPVSAWRVALDPMVMKQYRAGYFGCINHIDAQIGRILMRLPENTVIVFLSDHGEMLGDHQWIRKRNAFEPSVRIPFFFQFPPSLSLDQSQVRDELVELMDVMPTLLEAAGCPVPPGLDGRSLMPLLKGQEGWREYLHGECADIPTLNSGMQYLTNGRRKYVWYPGTGDEQLFDLENDPREMVDLAKEKDSAKEIERWRRILVQELDGRPEGFVTDGTLSVIGGPTPHCLPGRETPGVGMQGRPPAFKY